MAIEGHADPHELRTARRRDFAQQRAEAVLQTLVRYGVAPSRLAVRSFGDVQPVAPGGRPEQRALNRRVEFRVEP